MAGAVLNTLNTRLDAEAIGFMLDHAEAKVLLTDREFSATVSRLARAKRRPLVIDVETRRRCASAIERIHAGTASVVLRRQWDAISLNYTSARPATPKASSTTTAALI